MKVGVVRMGVTAQEVYDQALMAYRKQEYRQAVRLLDRNWKSIYEPICNTKLGEELYRLRERCRESAIARQISSSLANPSPGMMRQNRKLAVMRRRQRKRRRYS